MTAVLRTSTHAPTYRDELAMVRHFVHVLEEGLGGRDHTRQPNAHPLDWCHLGVLGPCKPTPVAIEAQEEQPEGEEEGGDDKASVEAEKAKSARAVRSPMVRPAEKKVGTESELDQATPADRKDDFDAVRRPPSALGFEILVQPKELVELEVEASFSIFTKHLPTRAEQSATSGFGAPLAEVTQRWPIQVSGIRFSVPPVGSRIVDDGSVQAAVDATLASAFNSPDAGRQFPKGAHPKVDEEALKNDQVFDALLASVKSDPLFSVDRWQLKVKLELRIWPRADGKIRIGCYLRNETAATLEGAKDAFLVLGDASLKARLGGGELFPVEILPVPEDYQYDRRVWAVGHNTSVRVGDDRRHISTHALAYYEQARVATRDTPPAKFDAVAHDTFPTLEAIYAAMQEFAEDWQGRVIGTNALNLDQAELRECAKDLDRFRAEMDRFASGLAALQKDARLLRAFQAMNRIFGRLAKGYDAWRLFQIVFIVTQMPALAIRENTVSGEFPKGVRREWQDALDWGDVLWFRTGAGKTEAYLGLTCCAILYDRLRGKKQGVTAWLRFPLRMLSVQQLQRAMRIVWETEKERQGLLGADRAVSDPIRLGYFVGSTLTPNSLSEEELSKYESPGAAERLCVVPDCPACEGKGTVRVSPDKQGSRFKHVCSAPGCGAELPLDVSDDEVYRHLPALIIGTVDKMASIGQQPKYGLLWGGAKWRCPIHGYSFGEYCTAYLCKVDKKARIAVSPYDPAPALHIQDELHLLQEELGAFAGHYETLVRYCEASASSKPAKVVAATATIEGFEHQVRHLYGVRGARRFPGRGYERVRSFYAEPDTDGDGATKTARVFVAFRSASLHRADAAALCTELLQTEIYRLIHAPHRALAFLKDAKTEDDVCALLVYYTTTLNYVGSLASGSRVKDALEEVATKTRQGASREMKVEYHSSRSSGAEVAGLVHRVENPPPWADPEFLDAVVATNMISHGVDLERINLMTMDGMPEETAEYIQASSRSGRKHVGLLMVVLPSYSLRAASIYQRFLEYHEHLDRMVSPVPVNRFAKYAARRTLPGIFIGLLYGRHAVQKGTQKLKLRHEADTLFTSMGKPALEAEVTGAYALGQNVYDPSLEKSLQSTLSRELDTMLLSIHNSHEKQAREAVRPAPMMSLRDVEVGVPFNPEPTLDHRRLVIVLQTKE